MAYETRHLLSSDYKQYMDLMFEFTNYRHDISDNEFHKQLHDMDQRHKIIVMTHHNSIIGAGSLFVLHKLHNNPVGQIEDVIITKKYRSRGLGKTIIETLTRIGLEMGCYKIVLNCLDHNIQFYEKCGFQKVAAEMKFIPK